MNIKGIVRKYEIVRACSNCILYHRSECTFMSILNVLSGKGCSKHSINFSAIDTNELRKL